MPWTLRLERTVPFGRDDVYAWWTDFREDDHRHPGSPAQGTREVLRQAGGEVWLRDRAAKPARLTVTAHVVLDPPRAYRVEARYPGADAEYEYRFEPLEHGGTRVVMHVALRPRHLGWIFLPLSAPWWRRYVTRDLDFHMAAMSQDLGR